MTAIGNNAKTIGRVLNQAGAEVLVLSDKSGGWFGWHCTGCRQGMDPNCVGGFTQADGIRKLAGTHASTCNFQS